MNAEFKKFSVVFFPLLAIIILVPAIFVVSAQSKSRAADGKKAEVARLNELQELEAEEEKERLMLQEEKETAKLKEEKLRKEKLLAEKNENENETAEKIIEVEKWREYALGNFSIRGVEIEPSTGTIFMTIIPSKISTKEAMEKMAILAAKSYCFQTNSRFANVRIVDPYTQKFLASGDYWHEVKASNAAPHGGDTDALHVNVPSLYGLRSRELRSEFSSLSGGGPESSASVSNWKSWKTVNFYFNGGGRLAQISFIPEKPFARSGAQRYTKKILGLENEPGNKVRTINLSPVYGGGDVESVDIFFDIGWRD